MSQGYYAYGRKRRGGTLATDHTFTGQKRDGTGLMYYNARYYDPVIGTFISPDTIVPDVTSVFSYNRYMYTRGNPLNRIDPTGHIDGPYLDPGSNCYRWCGVATMNPRPHPMAGPPDLPTREQVQTTLDVIGTVDPTGIADATNAAIYAAEGEYVDALLTAGAILPLGDALKAGKYADEVVEFVGRNADELLWTSWRNYPKTTLDGREYAQIGDRLYTRHAVDRMQPSGLGAPAGQIGPGRSISPNFIEEAIQNGTIETQIVNGVERTIYYSGNVQVATEQVGRIVISVNPYSVR